MGKRELILVVAFAAVGALMYQLTAAPPPPGSSTVNVGGVIDHLRRAVRGNRANAELASTTTHRVSAATSEVRLRLGSTANVTVAGEEREDVEINLKVWSNGYDEAEARKLAQQSIDALKVDDAGLALIATVTYPGPGQQRPTAIVKVPLRLKVRIEQVSTLNAAGLSALELGPTRGTATIKNVSGLVSGSHRGGRLTLEQVGTVKLNARGSDVHIAGASDVSLTLNAGSLNATGITGAVEIEANEADITLPKLETTKGPVRVNANGGTVTMNGLRVDTRVDARDTNVVVAMQQAAPLAIYTVGEGSDIRLTPPPGGYRMDAVAREAELGPRELIEKLGLTYTPPDEAAKEARAAGQVGGGGPTITLRSTRGAIVFATVEAVEKAVEKAVDKK